MCGGKAAFQGLNWMGMRKIIVFEGLPEQTAHPKKAFIEKKQTLKFLLNKQLRLKEVAKQRMLSLQEVLHFRKKKV